MTLLSMMMLAASCSGSSTTKPPDNGDTPGVNLPPVAEITARIMADLRVEFNAGTSTDPDGQIARYDWNFHWSAESSGTWELIDAGPEVAFTYSEEATYLVQVQVTDNEGTTATDTIQITLGETNGGDDVDPVEAGVPFARLTSYPGTTPLSIQLDASASFDMDGEIVRFDWDFDNDGTIDQENGPDSLVYTYDEAGIYTVRVRVTDDAGQSADALLQVTITGEINDPTNQAPEAAVGASPTEGTAPLEVLIFDQGSQDPDGWIATYEWDIDGDGEFEDTTSGGTVDKTFTEPGTYIVTLRITDDQGKTDTASITITVSEEGASGNNLQPVAKAGATPLTGSIPLEVTVYDQGSSDEDGWIDSYDWDFDNDGVYELIGNPGPHELTLTTAGDHVFRLRVTDNGGAEDTAEVTVNVSGSLGGGSNLPPVAKAGASPTTGDAPLQVSIFDQGSSDEDGWIDSYDWDFDNDGVYELIGNPGPHERTYDTPGLYTVKLRVTDNQGAQATTSVSINVTGSGGGGTDNLAPVAIISATPILGDAPLDVKIFDLGSLDPDGSLVSFDWDLDGDGNFEILDHPGPHYVTYPDPGVYLVSLRVTDDAGAKHTGSVAVVVLTPSS